MLYGKIIYFLVNTYQSDIRTPPSQQSFVIDSPSSVFISEMY